MGADVPGRECVVNELLFLSQILFAFAATAFFLRKGKEALFVWLGMLSLLANLFVTKQIHLFGMEVTASDAYAVALLLALNLIQEYWGKGEAKKAGMIAIFVQIAFLLFSELHLLFEPSLHDTSQGAYQAVLGAFPRLLGASLITFYIVQRFDRWFFGTLAERLRNSSFSLRNALSISCSQCLDTALFTLLGLYGAVANAFDVFLMSFAVKAFLISTLSLFTLYLKPKAYDVSL